MNEPQENLTALDMLTLQNAKLTSERDQAIRELAKLSRENAEALQRVEAENERLKMQLMSERYKCEACSGGPCYCRPGWIVPCKCVGMSDVEPKWQALKGGK